MKSLTFIVLTLYLSVPLFAQEKSIQIHPIIGDTISQNEKILFLLFPDIQDSLFRYGTIVQDDNNTYRLNGIVNNKVYQKKLNFNEFNEYRTNIDKLLVYFASLKDSISSKNQVSLNNQNPLLQSVTIRLTAEQQKKLAKEANRYNALKLEAEEKGLWGTDMDNYIKTKGYCELPLINTINK